MIILERTPPSAKRYEDGARSKEPDRDAAVQSKVFSPLATVMTRPQQRIAGDSSELMYREAPFSPGRARMDDASLAPQRRSPVASRSRLSLTQGKHVAHSPTSMRRNEPESFSRQSPEHSQSRDSVRTSPSRPVAGPSRSIHRPQNGRSHLPRPQPAVDRAFEEQMERALASGENPFMDRKRAQMRDEGVLPSSPQQDYAPHCDGIDHLKRQKASTSSVHSGEHDYDATDRSGPPANDRLKETDKNAPTVLSGDSSASLGGQQEPSGTDARGKSSRGPREEEENDRLEKARVEAIKRERDALSKRAQELEAQVEDLHSREGRLEERLAAKKHLIDRKNGEIANMEMEAREVRGKLESLSSELLRARKKHLSSKVKHIETLYSLRRESMQSKIRTEEKRRNAAVDGVVARNEATFLRARLAEAEARFVDAANDQVTRCEALEANVADLEREKESVLLSMEYLKGRAKTAEEEVEKTRKDARIAQRKADRFEALQRERDADREEVSRLREELQRARRAAQSPQKRFPAPQSSSPRRAVAAPSASSPVQPRRPAPQPVKQSSNLRTSKTQRPAPTDDSESKETSANEASLGEDYEDEGESRAPASDTASTPVIHRARVRAGAAEQHRQGHTGGSKTRDAQKGDDIPKAASPAAKARLPMPATREIPKGRSVTGKREAAAMAVRADGQREVRKPGRPLQPPQRAPAAAKAVEEDDEGSTAQDSSSFSASKTPLLPSKRARAINGGEALPDPSSEADGANDSLLAAETPVLVKRAVKPAAKVLPPSESVQARSSPIAQPKKAVASAVPIKAPAPVPQPQQQQKKKRRLLNTGAPRNVATDFLNWNGDAEGALDPQLNLPFELSPVKKTSKPPGGAMQRGVAAGSVFGRR